MLTLNPETVFLDFETPTWKRPSPSTKPANQLGSKLSGIFIKGLLITTIFEKAVFNSSDKPKFKDF